MKTSKYILCVLGLAVLPWAASAGSITIVNPSFEADQNDGTWFTIDGTSFPIPFITPQGWNAIGTINVNEPGPAAFPGGVPNGVNVAVAGVTGSSGDSLYQDTGAVITAGMTYSLSVYVGDRLDYPGSGTIALQAFDGTNATTLASMTDTAALGTFDLVTVKYTALGSNPFLGDTLRVSLADAGGNQASFDSVALTGSATPEPFTMAMMAAGLGIAIRRIKGR